MPTEVRDRASLHFHHMLCMGNSRSRYAKRKRKASDTLVPEPPSGLLSPAVTEGSPDGLPDVELTVPSTSADEPPALPAQKPLESGPQELLENDLDDDSKPELLLRPALKIHLKKPTKSA